MMNNKILIWASVIIILLMGVSCKKDDSSSEGEIPDNLPVYIYRAGTEMSQDSYRALYTKNKNIYYLSPIAGGHARANDIKVVGQDVYVVGTESNAENNSEKAILWVNGTAQELSTPDAKNAEALSVFVSDSDVYVAGVYLPKAENATQRAVVWKNGNPVTIGHSDIITRLEDIFVLGNDVHVVGYENHNPGIISKYWKNGKETVLSKKEKTTYAKSIYVDGSDVYIAGYTDGLGERSFKVWENGVPTNLISGTKINRGLDVTVKNENVYAAGYEQVGSKYVPRVFKNNSLLPMQYSSSGHVYAFAVQVIDEDVYVLGSEETGDGVKNIVWENGKEIETLSNTSKYTDLMSMVVVPKEEKVAN